MIVLCCHKKYNQSKCTPSLGNANLAKHIFFQNPKWTWILTCFEDTIQRILVWKLDISFVIPSLFLELFIFYFVWCFNKFNNSWCNNFYLAPLNLNSYVMLTSLVISSSFQELFILGSVWLMVSCFVLSSSYCTHHTIYIY